MESVLKSFSSVPRLFRKAMHCVFIGENCCLHSVTQTIQTIKCPQQRNITYLSVTHSTSKGPIDCFSDWYRCQWCSYWRGIYAVLWSWSNSWILYMAKEKHQPLGLVRGVKAKTWQNGEVEAVGLSQHTHSCSYTSWESHARKAERLCSHFWNDSWRRELGADMKSKALAFKTSLVSTISLKKQRSMGKCSHSCVLSVWT